MTTKKIFSFSLAITIAHFALTLAIGHYLAVQVGSQMGQVVASGSSDISKQKTEAETNEICQKMKSNEVTVLCNLIRTSGNVIPAKAGIHKAPKNWTPAFAGATDFS